MHRPSDTLGRGRQYSAHYYIDSETVAQDRRQRLIESQIARHRVR